MTEGGYVELHAASAFSFLCGGSQPEQLVERAAQLGMGIRDPRPLIFETPQEKS